MSRILIVEDEARIASFLDKGLRANGFATDIAADGAEALRLTRIGDYDLVILDLGLSDLDGLQVLGKLRGRGLAAPVIILTARDGDTVAGLEGGADDYVTKPAVSRSLSSSGARQVVLGSPCGPRSGSRLPALKSRAHLLPNRWISFLGSGPMGTRGT